MDSYHPAYGDLSDLNTNGLILRAVGRETLQDIAADLLQLLGTSSAIYEKNGDYAIGIFASGWCQCLDATSFALCDTDDPAEALASGKWLCHESCWQDASCTAIETGEPVDVACAGGLRLYAMPIRAKGEVIGAINFGYGEPPSDTETLNELAERFNVSVDSLTRAAKAYEPRDDTTVEWAKQRLQHAARIIGQLVEAQQTRQQLEDREQEYQRLFSSMLDGMAVHEMIFDEEGRPVDYRFLSVNKAFEQLTGLKREDILGRTVLEVLPTTEQSWIDIYGKVVQTGEPTRFEHGTEALGKYFEVMAYRPEPNKFACIFTDITDQKRAEKALRESEEQYRQLAESTEAILWEYDIQADRWTYVAPQAERILGWEPEAWNGIQFWVEHIHPDDRQQASTYCAECTARGESHEFEYRFLRKDGTPVWLRDVVSVEMQDGKPVMLRGFMMDISDRKHMEEQLRQAEKMQAIGELAGGIAHDFNNQLAAVLGYAELLSDTLQDGELKNYAQSIAGAARRSADLTSQLLAFARKGTFAGKPQQTVDLHETIRAVVLLLRRGTDQHIRIDQDIEACPATTLGDPAQIESMLLNLALNARDAMPDGGTLTFRTRNVTLDEAAAQQATFHPQPGPYVRIDVVDTGYGMDEAMLQRIFDPFFTTKDVGKGTGMGLACVHGTVERHGGTLDVHSTPDGGTTFCILLPETHAQNAPSPPHTTRQPQTNNARVLVVDDEPMAQKVLHDMLLSEGMHVTTADDGQQAVNIVSERPGDFDAMVLDMSLPQLSGAEVLKIVHDLAPQIGVVLCSGYDLTTRADDFRQHGAVALLQKPCSRQELLQAVGQAAKTAHA